MFFVILRLITIFFIFTVLLHRECFADALPPGFSLPQEENTVVKEIIPTSPVTCKTYREQIKNDIIQINQHWEGGALLHKEDLWAIALSMRLIGNAELYLTECVPQKHETDASCAIMRDAMTSHLYNAEIGKKHDVAQTNYATRARADAVTLACFCPGTVNPTADLCRSWKEKSKNKIWNANHTQIRDPIIMFSVSSTTYGFLYRTFCK